MSPTPLITGLPKVTPIGEPLFEEPTRNPDHGQGQIGQRPGEGGTGGPF
jgi:hypothetical protein